MCRTRRWASRRQQRSLLRLMWRCSSSSLHKAGYQVGALLRAFSPVAGANLPCVNSCPCPVPAAVHDLCWDQCLLEDKGRAGLQKYAGKPPLVQKHTPLKSPRSCAVSFQGPCSIPLWRNSSGFLWRSSHRVCIQVSLVGRQGRACSAHPAL